MKYKFVKAVIYASQGGGSMQLEGIEPYQLSNMPESIKVHRHQDGAVVYIAREHPLFNIDVWYDVVTAAYTSERINQCYEFTDKLYKQV